MDGRVEVLRSRLFPLGTPRRNVDFQRATSELADRVLILNYEFDGKPFIQVTKWRKCTKSEHSHYPWKDGTFEIIYVEVLTRDGTRDFVSTSLPDPIGIPSEPHPDPIPIVSQRGKGEEGRVKDEGGSSEVVIPERLNTPEFIALWAEFAKHRLEIKHPLTPTAAQRMLKSLIPYGPSEASRKIERSIANGWRGVLFAGDKPSRLGARNIEKATVFND